MQKWYEQYWSEGYVAHKTKKNLATAHKMGNFKDAIAEPEYKPTKPVWNKTVCKTLIKEYANIIAELNIADERAGKRHQKFVDIIIQELSMRTYKSETELDNYVKIIKFNVDDELRKAGYEV